MRELKRWQDWDVVSLIGRGNFGAVFEIQRNLFDETEKAALKVISIPQNETEVRTLRSEGYDDESITMAFNDQLQGILKEYMLMRKLNGNTNVVNCDDVQRVQHDDGMGWDVFIKMELLEPMAESLPRVVSDGQVIKIGVDICNALILCDKFNIIHRDIKPQNIFISPYGDYKLGDFGVARTMERTAGGTKIGTYNYMAPEVYNNQDYNHTVDIYSLGLVLYWLLNERRTPFMPLPPVFPKVSDQENARYRRFRGEALPAPKHGSDGLKAIVLKACAFDPRERYQSAAEMKQAMEALGKTEEKPVEIAPIIDVLTEDDPTMGAWPPDIEPVPVVEPVIADEPVIDDEDTVVPTVNKDKTVGMWAAIEAERERKRREAEEAEKRHLAAEQKRLAEEAERWRLAEEQKRLAEEAAEQERLRLLEEQRIRDEKAAELQRLREQEDKKKYEEEQKQVKSMKKLLPVVLLIVLLIWIGIGELSGRTSPNTDSIDNTETVQQTPLYTNLSSTPPQVASVPGIELFEEWMLGLDYAIQVPKDSSYLPSLQRSVVSSNGGVGVYAKAGPSPDSYQFYEMVKHGEIVSVMAVQGSYALIRVESTGRVVWIGKSFVADMTPYQDGNAMTNSMGESIRERLPVVTFVMSGETEIYGYYDKEMKVQNNSCMVRSGMEEIVITDVSEDGSALCIRYPVKDSYTLWDIAWFRTEDVFPIMVCEAYLEMAEEETLTYKLAANGTSLVHTGRMERGNRFTVIGSLYQYQVIAYSIYEKEVCGLEVSEKMALIEKND